MAVGALARVATAVDTAVVEMVAIRNAPSGHSPHSPCLARTRSTANCCRHHHTSRPQRTEVRPCSRLSTCSQAAGAVAAAQTAVLLEERAKTALVVTVVMVEAMEAMEGTADVAVAAASAHLQQCSNESSSNLIPQSRTQCCPSHLLVCSKHHPPRKTECTNRWFRGTGPSSQHLHSEQRVG